MQHIIGSLELQPGGIKVIPLCGATLYVGDAVAPTGGYPQCTACWQAYVVLRENEAEHLRIDLYARAWDAALWEESARNTQVMEAARRLDGTHEAKVG